MNDTDLQFTGIFMSCVENHPCFEFDRTQQHHRLVVSDVQYINFISISRYFCSYRTVSKSILHLLMLHNYRTAEFSNNISNYQA